MLNKIFEKSAEVKVKIINWNPIIERISKFVQKPIEIRAGTGFIGDINYDGIISIIIDKECCEIQSHRKNMYIPDVHNGIMSIDMFEGINIFAKDNNGLISIFPLFKIDIDEDEIKKYLTEEMSLPDYMGDRYRYNSRVTRNEEEILKCIFRNK
jgi:hypothetical protein